MSNEAWPALPLAEWRDTAWLLAMTQVSDLFDYRPSGVQRRSTRSRPLSPVAGQIVAQEDIIATLVRFCRRSVGAADTPALRTVVPLRQDAP